VVVASIQMRTLKTEVEEGSMRTAIGHGLVSPEMYRNCFTNKRGVFGPFFRTSKGKQANIPALVLVSMATCLKESRDDSCGPREGSLSFLTALIQLLNPGTALFSDRVGWLVKHRNFCGVGCPMDIP